LTQQGGSLIGFNIARWVHALSANVAWLLHLTFIKDVMCSDTAWYW
jgi:hypothetical protein